MSKTIKVLHQCINYLACSHSLSIGNLFFSSASKLPNSGRKRRAAEEEREMRKLVRCVSSLDGGHAKNPVTLMAKPLLASGGFEGTFIGMRGWEKALLLLQMKLKEWWYKTFQSGVLPLRGGWKLGECTGHCIIRKNTDSVTSVTVRRRKNNYGRIRATDSSFIYRRFE